MKWEAVFWDFDGVILDSVDVKTKAFALMFEQYGPDIQQQVVDYHLMNGGVSRFDKFRYYYENILHLPINEEKVQELSKQFSQLVVQKVVESAYIPGALESLQFLKEKSVPCFIVSGTPHVEIKLITEKKGLAHFFKEIHGSPRKKWNIVNDILLRMGYTPEHCLFIGDAMSDYLAAEKNNTLFLGVVNSNGESIFPTGTPITTQISL